MGTGTTQLKLGIAGCGRAARIHAERLVKIGGITIVGCSDPDLSAARGLAQHIAELTGGAEAPSFKDHRELLSQARPSAFAIFTPHVSHYRPAMDALQAGCHVFIEKPLSTNLQEAADIVGLAKGRKLKVGVGHQYRLRPSFVEAKKRLEAGTIGPLKLIVGTLAQPWLSTHEGTENTWRFDPKVSGGGILADAGDHIIDTLIWTTGQVGVEAAAFQTKLESGLDLVTAAAIRLSGGIPVTLGVTGVFPGNEFELTYFGEQGRLRVSENMLEESIGEKPPRAITLPGPSESIDSNFVSALTSDSALCCPADQALDTVRLLEAIMRSASTGQILKVI
ncbi:MAG: oxidoreductase [Planctomycetes bacterium SCN 63-9]|nr:MAG: oxidoreductase [Planctomycetes bacterium SCN 63-9]